jgi:hypothetical protein
MVALDTANEERLQSIFPKAVGVSDHRDSVQGYHLQEFRLVLGQRYLKQLGISLSLDEVPNHHDE